MSSIESFRRAVPKLELHVHLPVEGSARDLAAQRVRSAETDEVSRR